MEVPAGRGLVHPIRPKGCGGLFGVVFKNITGNLYIATKIFWAIFFC